MASRLTTTNLSALSASPREWPFSACSIAACLLLQAPPQAPSAQEITAAGKPAQLDIRAAGEGAIRVTLKPVDYREDAPFTPAVADPRYPPPSIRALASVRGRCDPGSLQPFGSFRV